METQKTLIRKATVYDGSGTKPFVADVLLSGEKIDAIGSIQPEDGWEIVNAEGLALSPGFINTHSHMELELLKHPEVRSVVEQGITTEILGQDGSSVAPVYDENLEELMDNMAPLAGELGKPYSWRSYKDYMDTVHAAKPAARFEGLVGHGTIRMCVMGSENRKPTDDELRKMQELLAKCFEEGAKGLSFGLIYPPIRKN